MTPTTGFPEAVHAPATDPALSGVVLPLLKGVLYREDSVTNWSNLLNLQGGVRDYVAVLGLELIIDETEGFAFLRSLADDAAGVRLPRLVVRRPLSFPVSLLLALLRKRLAEFDASGADTRLIITRDEAAELMRIFLPQGSNEARLIDQMDTHLKRTTDLGFIRELKTARSTPERAYVVLRIIKSFGDAEWLAEFDRRLAEYREHAAGPQGTDDEQQDAAGQDGLTDE
jgi:hypothetical protein